MNLPIVLVISPDGSRSLFAAHKHSVLREEIGRMLEYPEFARRHYIEGVVNTVFHVETDGSLHVTSCSGNQQALTGYVEQRLATVNLHNHSLQRLCFRLMLYFKLL